ncbi:UNVERIFIED_CONTAM: hypothetical protein K2H54_060835 [Gekko kuhli]
MAPEKLPIDCGDTNIDPDPDDAIVTKRDLKEDRQILIQEISSLVKDLMQPMQTSLSELVREVKDTTKMAETASELALKMQSEVRALQSTEQTTLNRIATLEALEKRRKLKLVTSKLNESKIRFRWTQTSDIQVYRNGLQYHATDGVTGKALLSALGLRLTPEEESALIEAGT